MTNYEGYYETYDAGHIDEDGYIWIMSRTDDIINVAGHRLSTGAIEEVLSEHQSVAECAGPIVSLTIFIHSFEIVSSSFLTPVLRTTRPIGN